MRLLQLTLMTMIVNVNKSTWASLPTRDTVEGIRTEIRQKINDDAL